METKRKKETKLTIKNDPYDFKEYPISYLPRNVS